MNEVIMKNKCRNDKGLLFITVFHMYIQEK
jgi:hypothetical protein